MCTTNLCDAGGVCQGFPNSAFCEDGNACTIYDSCGGGICWTGAPLDCDDSDPCTIDSCDEALGCMHAAAPSGTACDDGDTCTEGEACAAGVCVPGEPTDCDDGSPCTTDGCDPADGCIHRAEPQLSGCFQTGNVKLVVHDEPSDAGDSLSWIWKRGSAISAGALGDPTISTTYALCLFDLNGAAPERVAELIVPAGSTAWSRKPGKVFYKDPSGGAGGIKKVVLVAGSADGKSKASLKAEDGALQLPGPVDTERYFAADPLLVVQLHNSDGACWTSALGGDAIKVNTTTIFKAAMH